MSLIKSFTYNIFLMNGLFDSNSSLGLKKISKIPSDVSIISRLSMIFRGNVVLNRTVVASCRLCSVRRVLRFLPVSRNCN